MPFAKGQSGNPGGRPKQGYSLAATLERFGHKRNPDTKHRYYDDMVRAVWALAAKGNLDAIRYIMDRVLGRPAQEIKLDQAQPTLVFQIIDPRLPVLEAPPVDVTELPKVQGPDIDLSEQAQDVVEGEVLDTSPRPDPSEVTWPQDMSGWARGTGDLAYSDPDSET